MLQQTQVETVIPFYHRFLARFPDIEALVAASPEAVLKVWAGLGHYRRASYLQPAASEVLKLGGWPTAAEDLATLPGVGRSTAGAIASFAFGLPSPVLDGNVRRVWWRLGALDLSYSPFAEKVLWSLSEAAVLCGDPAEVNQALMELGALVCLPKSPRCETCPVQKRCSAYANGKVSAFPPPKLATKRPRVPVSVALIFAGSRFLVTKRAEGGFLGGLWELPGGKWEKGESGEEAVRREAREELGIEVEILRALPPVVHAYTQFSVTLYPFICALAPRSVSPRPVRPMKWILKEEISSLPFPSGTLKIFGSLKSWDWETGERPFPRAAEGAPIWED